MEDVSRDPEAYARLLGIRLPPAPLAWRPTPSGALVAAAGDVVLKAHAERAVGAGLDRRLACASGEQVREVLVSPLCRSTVRAPGTLRLVSAWPHVVPLRADADADALPWAAAGGLLARLHRADPPAGLPRHGAADRVVRAALRLETATLSGALPALLRRVASRLADESAAALARERRAHLVHGDWHLGQVAATSDGLRLLDLDDLGGGDPVWDLGRPGGFWAAGLLASEDWEALLTAYRAAGGPAVPASGDPWPRLDLAARAAVLVGAVQQLLAASRPGTPAPGADEAVVPADPEALEALSVACARM